MEYEERQEQPASYIEGMAKPTERRFKSEIVHEKGKEDTAKEKLPAYPKGTIIEGRVEHFGPGTSPVLLGQDEVEVKIGGRKPILATDVNRIIIVKKPHIRTSDGGSVKSKLRKRGFIR